MKMAKILTNLDELAQAFLLLDRSGRGADSRLAGFGYRENFLQEDLWIIVGNLAAIAEPADDMRIGIQDRLQEPALAVELGERRVGDLLS